VCPVVHSACKAQGPSPRRPASPPPPNTPHAPPYTPRALALTVDELRALFVLALGAANLMLLFLSRALAAEQLAGDEAKLNLEVLQRQARASGGIACLC
jgi:hypothetical protein